MIGLIWAQARDAAERPVIGSGGTIPWRVPEDFAHFRSTTYGHPVIMGRRTWESLPPWARPLPGRTNVVITGRADWVAEAPAVATAGDSSQTGSVAVVPSFVAALPLAAAAEGGGEVWVIGGGRVYAEALPLADRCVITDIDLTVDGDTFAPELGADWNVCQAGSWRASRTGVRYRIRLLERQLG